MAGSSTSLLCEVLNLPCRPYSGPWFFHLLKIENSSLLDIGVGLDKGNGDLLINFTIVNANKNDSGKYQCNFVYSKQGVCPLHLYKVYNVKGTVIVYGKKNCCYKNTAVIMKYFI